MIVPDVRFTVCPVVIDVELMMKSVPAVPTDPSKMVALVESAMRAHPAVPVAAAVAVRGVPASALAFFATAAAYFFTALNRASIPELKRIWQLSLTEMKGVIVRTLITEKMADIARANKLAATDTFEELYKTYQTRKMQRRVNHMPKTWTKYDV